MGSELVYMDKIKKENLTISSVLLEFVNKEVIPGTDVDAEDFGKNLILLFTSLRLSIKL